MNRIVIDDSMRDTCQQAVGPLEVYDRNGRVLGYFIGARDKLIYRLLDSELTEEEIQERIREGGRPLDDILRDLESR
jgi:hypothetical protein